MKTNQGRYPNSQNRGERDSVAKVSVIKLGLDVHADSIRVVRQLDHATPPPSEAERGQLLRALASDAIRGALERHFGVRFAFQNCHRVAAFRPADVGSDCYLEFVSVRSQVLNQSPALRDC